MLFDLGRHGGYILASYIAAFVILGGLIVASVRANRAARRQLEKLERGER
jgi:heme exporter protein CcmD